jgi:hypothetical protein
MVPYWLFLGRGRQQTKEQAEGSSDRTSETVVKEEGCQHNRMQCTEAS